MDLCKYTLCECQMFFALPWNLIFRQHMMVTTYPKPDWAIFLIVNLRVWYRKKVQIDDIVQRAHCRLRDL